MSLIPGYDFTLNEEVTAENLRKWILGTTTDAAIAMPGLAMGTGASLTGMTNEGDLERNFNDGRVYLKTRWGQVPLMGGGFFTKRVAQYFAGNDSYKQNAWYSAFYSLGPHGGAVTQFSVTPDSIVRGIGPENSYCYASWYQEGAGKKWIMAPLVPWPSAELDDPGYDRTMGTCLTTIHPTFCLLGVTPLFGTVQTSYTGQRPLIDASSRGIQFNSAAGNVDQYNVYTSPIAAVAPNYKPVGSGVTNLHWGVIMPCLGTASVRGFHAMNLRI